MDLTSHQRGIKGLVSALKVFFYQWFKNRIGKRAPKFQEETLVLNDPGFHYFIDQLILKDYGLFGYGWALHDLGSWSSHYLELQFSNAPSKVLDLFENVIREDLRLAFPDHSQALNSGFLIIAGWNKKPPVAATLNFLLPDRSVRQIHLDLNYNSTADNLIRKFADHQKALNGIRNSLNLAHKPVFLVLNHTLEGGADVFWEEITQRALDAGETVFLFSFHLNSLSFNLKIRSADAEPLVLKMDGTDALARIFDGFVFNKILINCLVSFPKTTKILHLVNSLQIRDNAKLIIAVHDYFTVCPSANLLNSSGKFCAIPDMETCRVCLPEHRNGFVSLAGETSVEKWRSAWRTLMKPGTELVCFSTSSLNLLTTAYPEVTGMVNVLPHKPVPLRSVRIPAHPGGAVIVGVIGNISYHKGSQVVADLAKAISAAGAVVRIVVLGTISLHCPPEIVEYTGSYQRDELPDLAERHHINMVLMPSVCPETFSYVTHEVISMGLPLITLNLGAQADAARLYPKGRVSTHSDGPGLLQEILDFDAFINKNME